MQRRRFILAALGGLLGVPFGVDAQPAGNARRIGYLSSGSSSMAAPPVIDAFRQGLRDLGWVEGQNLVIDYRFAESSFDRLPDLAAELVRQNVEIIVATSTPAAVAAKRATTTIPVVMVNIGDPVGLGLIASLPRPGGNVTGISFSVGLEIIGKQLELLKETVPAVRRVAILSNPANPATAVAISNVKAAAQSLGLELKLLEVGAPDELDGAFAAMAREKVGAVLVVSDTMFGAQRARLADLAAKTRLPSMHGTRSNVEAGGLMYYGPNFPDQWRRGASFVDKILKGTNPADLPVEQPTKFELVVNLKTAKALGITIPQKVLARADEVIQ
jgi:putative ABC transport system substrate-binding protein